MSPMWDEQWTWEECVTQLLICEGLSLAICVFQKNINMRWFSLSSILFSTSSSSSSESILLSTLSFSSFILFWIPKAQLNVFHHALIVVNPSFLLAFKGLHSPQGRESHLLRLAVLEQIRWDSWAGQERLRQPDERCCCLRWLSCQSLAVVVMQHGLLPPCLLPRCYQDACYHCTNIKPVQYLNLKENPRDCLYS